MEGKIGPGLENRGGVAFRVPKDASGLRFEVSQEIGALWRLEESKAEKGEYDPRFLDRIYDQVEVGMTEDEVQEAIGMKPTWTDETDVENFDRIKNLIYNEPVSTSFNNVTIVLHKGKVGLVVLQEMRERHLVAVKAKT